MMQEFFGQTNFVGRDGFYWWMGQIETEKGSQPKGDDRYKVRIVGQHLKDCNAVSYGDLPWAIVMMPATAPRREGGSDYQSVKYKSGDWVVGFFLDGRDGQQPVIIGSVGQQYKASSNTGKEKPESECLAFTTFLDRDINLTSGVSSSESKKVAAGGVSGSGSSTQPTEDSSKKPDLNRPANASNETASAILLATKCKNSETNPAGECFCVEVSDAKCENTENNKSKFETVLSELFFNIQSSGGQFGNYVVSKYTGKLYNYIGIAQGYINKVSRLAVSVTSRIKGELFALTKQGVTQVLDFLLLQEVPDPAGTAETTGKEGPAKKKVGRLANITAWINKQLEKINCTIDDLDERLRKFIEGLIFGALEKIFNAARCFIDKIVNDILNQIASYLEKIISALMGPLQALLDIIANPLNILGAALAKIFDLLGISCGGPGKQCASTEQVKNCTNGCSDPEEDSEDFLDKLIESVENGNLDNAASFCDEAQTIPKVSKTKIVLIGGKPNPLKFTDEEDNIIPPDFSDPILDFDFGDDTDDGTDDIGAGDDGILEEGDIVEGSTDKIIIPPIKSDLLSALNILNEIYETNGSIINDVIGGAQEIITSSPVEDVSEEPRRIFNYEDYSIGKINLRGESTVIFNSVEDEDTIGIRYELLANKKIVFQGQSIKFTLVARGGEVPDGTIFNYAMFGTINSSNFFDNTTIGTMTMLNNVATKTITTTNAPLESSTEEVSFNVLEAQQSRNFIIASLSTVDEPVEPATIPSFKEPILGEPEVCDDGRILEIPILNPGDPYIVPPLAIVEGAGYGASADVLLDDEGYINKVRVVRPGIGYSPNRSDRNCFISQFAILNPGFGYYREPTVYVDGKSSVAKANIDSNGFVAGIELIDKTKTFACLPKIEIFGGNGLGAKALPIIECRDDLQYAEYLDEVAPSGTAEVIDCP